MAADHETYRLAMRRLPTGISVVTMRDAAVVHGMTANTVTSVSMDPLLILVCVSRGARAHSMIETGGRFVVNVLSQGQADVADAFATQPDAQRWAMVTTHEGPTGIPRIDGCNAWMECEVAQTLPGGDHTIFVAQVTDIELSVEHSPLVRWEGSYHPLA